MEEADKVKGQPTVYCPYSKREGIFLAEHNAAFHNGVLTQEQYLTAKRELGLLKE